MKRSIVAAGIAAVLATTTFAGNAMAQPDYWHQHYRHRHNDVGAAIVAGTVFGLIGSAIANSYDQPTCGYYRPCYPYYGYPYRHYYRPHYRPFYPYYRHRDWDWDRR